MENENCAYIFYCEKCDQYSQHDHSCKKRVFKMVSNKEFKTYEVNHDIIKNLTACSQIFDDLLNKLKEFCPESREFSIVKTKLEEAYFFAKKAIAINNINNRDLP